MKKNKLILTLFILLSFLLSGCIIGENPLVIVNGETAELQVGEVIDLDVEEHFFINGEPTWTSSNDDIIDISEDGKVKAVKAGEVVITATYGRYQDQIVITIIVNEVSLELKSLGTEVNVGGELELVLDVTPSTIKDKVQYEIVVGEEFAQISDHKIIGKKAGIVMLRAYYNNTYSKAIIIEVKEESQIIDPYVGVSKEEFYSDYKEATSYEDSYYRTLHGFMSGSILDQNQEPTVASYQPEEYGRLVRNTNAYYSEDGNTYYIVDSYGKVVDQVYKGGGYVSLEEVAAYVLAFGNIPANYTEKKSGSPSSSPWGKYLRCNHTNFTGDTSRYPYEPVLPDISGCGGNLYYYEIDLGTTGTDCDPGYPAYPYNDGSKITRGAARIVYTRYDKNKNDIIDINEKYVFYTYNHYNDFQEYLNYQGGWGEIFGNITGGGTISSKYDYNPTPYVRTSFKDFSMLDIASDFVLYDKDIVCLLEHVNKKKNMFC